MNWQFLFEIEENQTIIHQANERRKSYSKAKYHTEKDHDVSAWKSARQLDNYIVIELAI